MIYVPSGETSKLIFFQTNKKHRKSSSEKNMISGIPWVFTPPLFPRGAKQGGGGKTQKFRKSQILDDLLWKFGQKTLQIFWSKTRGG